METDFQFGRGSHSWGSHMYSLTFFPLVIPSGRQQQNMKVALSQARGLKFQDWSQTIVSANIETGMITVMDKYPLAKFKTGSVVMGITRKCVYMCIITHALTIPFLLKY